MYTKEEILKAFKRINWDYKISPEEMYSILKEDANYKGTLDKDWLYMKMLQNMRWNEIISILLESDWFIILGNRFIAGLFPKQRKEKYLNVRQLLLNNTISISR